MVKKILSSLASLTLVIGSVTSTTAGTKQTTQNHQKPPPQPPSSFQNYDLAESNFHQNTSFGGGGGDEKVYNYNNVIYVGTNGNGLWESFDNGKTFVQNKTVPLNINVENFYVYNKVIYLTPVVEYAPQPHYKGVLYESFDNGKTFSKNISIPSDPELEWSWLSAYNNVVYALLENNLYESFDNGKTFKKNNNLPDDNFFNNIWFYNNVVYLAGGSFYESFDNGKTFTKSQSFHDLVYIRHMRFMNNVIYVMTQNMGLYESTDNGKTFMRNKSLQLTNDEWGLWIYNNVIYVGTFKEGLYESTDNGKTFFQNKSLPTYFGSINVRFYNNTLYVELEDEDTEEVTLWESKDNGKTFTKNISFPQKVISIGFSINNITFYNNFVYAVLQNEDTQQFNLYESSDNGKTFTEKTSLPGDVNVGRMAVYNNIVYVFNANGLLYEAKMVAATNKPAQNKSLANEGATVDYLMYSNPINFTFDWTFLSKVTVKNNSTSASQTITSGDYNIKNDGVYEVVLYLDNGTKVTKNMLLKNGYDFSQGLNTTTWNPKTRELDILLNKTLSDDLLHEYSMDGFGILNFLANKSWTNLLTNKNIHASIDHFLGDSPSHYTIVDDSISFPLSAFASQVKNWLNAFKVKMVALNQSPDISQRGVAQKGLVFKIHLNADNTIANVPNANQLVQPIPQNHYQTNYWDQMLFNQT